MRRDFHHGLLALILILHAPGADGHPLAFTETTLTLSADRTFRVDMVLDLDALALGAPQDADDAGLVATIEALTPEELDDTLERLRQVFRRRVRVRFDDQPIPFEVNFPDHGTTRATQAEIPTVLGLTARLTGTVPQDATTLEFFASRAFSDVHLTIVDETRHVTIRSVLERGARSDPFDLAEQVTPPTTIATARQYVRLGFVHIVPRGLDHILFVLGLFLLSRRLGPLFWQVTAFTLAHAFTLTLGALNVVTLSPRVVEPLIALSIAWIGIENILAEGRRGVGSERRAFGWRLGVVFLFGLLHGLGFARVLTDLGLPESERLLALVTFNAGIELGQIAVIVGALVTLGWFRYRPWYRSTIVVPASGAIAIVGLIWTVQRVLG